MELTNAERWLRRVLRISAFIFSGETLVYLLPALIGSLDRVGTAAVRRSTRWSRRG